LSFEGGHLLLKHRCARAALTAFCLAGAVALSACNLTGVGLDEGRPPDLLDKVRAIDLSPRSLRQDSGSGATASPGRMLRLTSVSTGRPA